MEDEEDDVGDDTCTTATELDQPQTLPSKTDPQVSMVEIRQETMNVKKTLTAVKSEYVRESIECKKTSVTKENEEYLKSKKAIIEKSMERIDMSLEEVDILLTLAQNLEYVEIDKLSVGMQLTNLIEEGAWLKDEMNNIRLRLSVLDILTCGAEGERAYFYDRYQMKKHQSGVEPVEIPFGIEDERDDIEMDISEKVKTHNNLVFDFISQGRYEVAMGLCWQEMQATQSDDDLASLWNLHALVLRQKNDLEHAIESLHSALKFTKKLHGEGSIQTASVLKNIGLLQAKIGEYQNAVSTLKTALNIVENKNGAKHPDVAQQLHRLALLLPYVPKSTEDVEPYFKRAIQIYDANKVKCADDLSRVQKNLSTFYIRKEDYASAMKMLKELLTKYHTEQVNTGSAKGNISLWEFAELSAASEAAAATANSKFQFFGQISSPSFRAIVQDLITVYQRQDKPNEACILQRYLDWLAHTMSAVTISRRPDNRNSTAVTNASRPSQKPLFERDSHFNKPSLMRQLSRKMSRKS